jgi:hypothetical protein
MKSRSLDEIEADLKKIHPLIKPFVMVGTVIAAIAYLPFALFSIARSKDEGESDD